MKNTLQSTLTTYILRPQLWVTLMIFFLSLFFGIIQTHPSFNRQLIVFFSTLGGYNFIQHHRDWRKKPFTFTAFLCFIGMIGTLFLLVRENNLLLTLSILFLSIWVFTYNTLFIKFKFREIRLLKIFVIAFTWTCMILYIGNDFSFSFTNFLSLFLFILGITLPFDISDLPYDSIKTFPKLIGIQNSKIIAVMCLCISFYLFQAIHKAPYNRIWLDTCLISILFIIKSKENSFFLTRFWVESCSGIPFILYLLIR